MGELYDRMARDLKLKNLAVGTQQQYLACCQRFAAYHWRSPRVMGLEEAKEFLGHLMSCGGSPERLKMHVAGLKFLYETTLERPEVAKGLPWPKVPQKKPDILSGREVERILKAMTSTVPMMVVLTAYGAGLRVSEAVQLHAGDVDGQRRVIHVRQGKGKKDRYVMLPARLLTALRGYWEKVRPTGEWLFPGKTKGRHLHATAVNWALKEAVKRVGLKKRVTAHTLRHSFATHLLELGIDIRVIQELLGHKSLRTTAGYTQVSTKHIARVTSPLDVLGTKRAAVLG